MVHDADLLTTVDCSYETVRQNDPLSPAAIAAAADQGKLRVAGRTGSGRRLIARPDLMAFINARREARRAARPAGTAA
jgi:hypothetical protein